MSELTWFRPPRMPGWWAVTHTTPRRTLWVPTPSGSEDPGPELSRLGRWRWTHIREQTTGASENASESFDVSSRSDAKELPFWWVGTSYFREIADDDDDEVDEWQQ